MIDLYAMECPKTVSAGHYHLLRGICSASRREQVRKLVYQRDREIAVFTECLARYCIAKKFGFSFETLSFFTTRYGKPYITGTLEYFFNMSHSGDYIICGLSNEPIGVDVEKIGKAPLEVAEYCFSADEKRVLLEKKGKEADKYFYALWTLKEAYLKMDGTGLQNIARCSFSVDWENGKIKCFIDGKIMEQLVFSLMEGEDYIMASCGDGQAKLHRIASEELIEYIQWHTEGGKTTDSTLCELPLCSTKMKN